jgi:hypothetical protein
VFKVVPIILLDKEWNSSMDELMLERIEGREREGEREERRWERERGEREERRWERRERGEKMREEREE